MSPYFSQYVTFRSDTKYTKDNKDKMDKKVDPILASVLQRRFKSITEEMGLTLLRTTRSPILNEARDFVTGIYNHEGMMLEQTEYIPILAFAVQPALEKILEFFGEDLHEGDVILHNDVFSGGNQNNDVAVFKPVFFQQQLIAWAVCKGHQADIGGAVSGGYNPEAREVWQEAIRIPPLKIYERGELKKDVWNMIFANIRHDIVQEDIKAEIGGCVVGERGILKLLEKYGREKFERHVNYLFDLTENMVRSEIKAITDGVYFGNSTVYYDAVHEGSEMGIKLKVTVKGGDVTFDFTGSANQTSGFVNAPFAVTASASMLTFLMLINPDIPHNQGLIRPVNVISPEGSFLNAKYPAATAFGNSLTGPISDAIFRAFTQALPEKVTAGWNRFLGVTITGQDPEKGRPFVDILFLALKGGSGGTYQADGYDHIGLINCAGGILAQDYEMFEIQSPHFLLKHEYDTDSAGAGEWRGGLGVDTEFVMQGEGLTAITFGDGIEEGSRAFGIKGGKSGKLNRVELKYPNGEIQTLKSKEIVRNIPKGTIFKEIAGGGGGYGNPFNRPVENVMDDYKNGMISLVQTREMYGVIINPKTDRIDEIETNKKRGTKR